MNRLTCLADGPLATVAPFRRSNGSSIRRIRTSYHRLDLPAGTPLPSGRRHFVRIDDSGQVHHVASPPSVVRLWTLTPQQSAESTGCDTGRRRTYESNNTPRRNRPGLLAEDVASQLFVFWRVCCHQRCEHVAHERLLRFAGARQLQFSPCRLMHRLGGGL